MWHAAACQCHLHSLPDYNLHAAVGGMPGEHCVTSCPPPPTPLSPTCCHHPPTQGPWSDDDDSLLLSLQFDWGNKWKDIGLELGRHDESVRDRWRTLQGNSGNNTGGCPCRGV